MLKLKSISKTYSHNDEQVEVIKNFNLSVKNGSFIALVGPSGCGKTTLLRIIAGLINASGGAITLDKKKILRAGRDSGMVFQQFSLFPWLTVDENIAFGLNLKNSPFTVSSARGGSRSKIDSWFTARNDKENIRKKKIIEHYLEITGLKEFADFYPKNLSGGMQQRVAIARTLANNPKILIMDEPFGALDSQTKLKMQEFLLHLWQNSRKTVVFVTHDVEEAVYLANTVYVMSQRPSKIKSVFKISFSYPRMSKIKYTKRFLDLKKKISRELE